MEAPGNGPLTCGIAEGIRQTLPNIMAFKSKFNLNMKQSSIYFACTSNNMKFLRQKWVIFLIVAITFSFSFLLHCRAGVGRGGFGREFLGYGHMPSNFVFQCNKDSVL